MPVEKTVESVTCRPVGRFGWAGLAAVRSARRAAANVGGEVVLTAADEVQKPARRKRGPAPTKRTAAQQFLAEVGATEGVLSREVIDLARSRGIAEKTLRRARRAVSESPPQAVTPSPRPSWAGSPGENTAADWPGDSPHARAASPEERDHDQGRRGRKRCSRTFPTSPDGAPRRELSPSPA